MLDTTLRRNLSNNNRENNAKSIKLHTRPAFKEALAVHMQNEIMESDNKKQ